MAITGQNIIDKARLRSDLKLSRFYLDTPDLIGMLNDVIKEARGELIKARESYFQSSAPLTMASNAATLPTDFMKELGLSYGTSPNLTPIYPLDSFNDRFDCDGPRYWIAGRTLTIYPTNVAVPTPVTLDYVPDFSDIDVTNPIPVDLERFSEFLTVGLAIMIKTGRRQDSTALENRRSILLSEMISLAKGRRRAPGVPAIPPQDRSTFYGRRTYYPIG